MIRDLFKADGYYDKINDIGFRQLYDKGYDTLLIDIDNTLVPYYQKTADEEVMSLIGKLKNIGYNVIIFSNNWPWRVRPLAESTGLKAYAFCLKPLKSAYKKIIRENGLQKNRIICLGDQLLTDVLGARRMKLKVFYIKPLIEKDNYKTLINRALERYIFKKIINEKM